MKAHRLLLFGAVTLGAVGCYSSFTGSGPADSDAGTASDAAAFDAGPGTSRDAAGIDSATHRDAAAVDAPPVSPFAGLYEGTYMGSRNGTLFLEIRADGTFTMVARGTYVIYRAEGTIRVDGALNAEGRIGTFSLRFTGRFAGAPGSHTGMGEWNRSASDRGTWELHQVG